MGASTTFKISIGSGFMNFIKNSLLVILISMITSTLLAEPNRSGVWLRVEVGIVGSASDDILKSAVAQVKEQSLEGLIIQLDTPGGALDSTRSMVKQILAAPFPVVVWVGPSGSRAGSAGAFITLAGHVAAMAQGTNIGASHPVSASGKDMGNNEVSRKVEEDTTAFIESIAQERGRNIEVARSFVIASASITAKEALDNNVIDLIVPDVATLLEKIDGRKVSIFGKKEPYELRTAKSSVLTYERTPKQEFLEILSNPNLFYLLFVAGLIGLGFELTHPGALFPGVAGGICMILALIATSVLPVSFGAMLMLLVGVALMVAEVFVPSFGVLGIGGFIAFVVGSFLLVDPGNEQGLQVSWFTILPGALTIGATAATIGYLVLKAERSKPTTGSEALVGSVVQVKNDFVDGYGNVLVEGELWRAKSHSPDLMISNEDQVEVVDRNGLLLTVKKINNS